MSTIKSSDEHLTLNADGASKDIKFQANGVEKASISSTGAFTSTTIDATKLTGDLPAISGANLTGVGVAGISSSADATAITIDSSENVGFGVTPEPHHADWTGLDIGGMGTITGETAPAAGRQFTFNNNAYINTSGNWVYKHSSDEATQLQMFDGKFRFRTAPTGTADSNVTFTERLLINNDGRILAGEGSFAGGAETLTIRPVTDGGVNDYVLMLQTGTTNSATIIRFYTPNGVAGVVSTSGSSTSYGTSSDYRLKENVDYDWDATTRLKQLKPARFNWIEDDTNTLQDGFIAHEVSSVVPEAISGEKDGMETYTDENGDEKTRIAPQSIDQSKLVPLLVKTIQELEARIAALEA